MVIWQQNNGGYRFLYKLYFAWYPEFKTRSSISDDNVTMNNTA
jgi:hypothetical protein